MPDDFGLPTSKEIAQYEDVLSKAANAVCTMQESPFDKAKFDKACKDLQGTLDSTKNPYIWGNDTGSQAPFYDFPSRLKDIVDKGATKVMLLELQDELHRATEILSELKGANKANPLKNLLNKLS